MTTQTAATPFTKVVDPVFKLIARRNKLVGYRACLNGESISDLLFETSADAWRALDEAAYALAVNWNSIEAEQLPPNAPELGGDEEGDTVPPDRERFPTCKACATAEYPPSAMQSAFCTECVNAMLHGLENRFSASQVAFAFTRQSLAIEARIKRCVNCDGPHFTWQCPEVGRQLRATPKDAVALGRAICRMRWVDFRGFVALLISQSTVQLAELAESYVAYIQTYSTTDLTAGQVLKTWMQLIGDQGDGPAAPALRLAA